MKILNSPTTFLGFLALCASVVYAQGTCNMNTITGTYAVQSRCGIAVVASPASPPLWNAQIAPLSLVGQLTIRPDGNLTGFYWGMVGSQNFGTSPVPYTGIIKEINPDCTGLVQINPLGNEERFVVLKNGAEIHSISVVADAPPAAWQTTLHRISNHYQGPITSCGQQNLRGVYMVRCEAIDSVTGSFPFLGGVSLFRLQISGTGDFTGTGWFKSGPLTLQAVPLTGKLQVTPDCNVSGPLTATPMQGMSLTSVGRGVLFDEGQELFIQPVLEGPSPDLLVPASFASCQGTRMGQ